MPPAIFLAADAGVVDGSAWEFDVPIAAGVGDSLLVVLGDCNPAQDLEPPDGWTEVARLTGATSVVIVLRRIVDDSEPSTHVVPTNFAPQGAAVLLVYRALATELEAVQSGFADVAASSNFPCPTLGLVRYADVYLGAAFVDGASVAISPPAGATERFDGAGNVASQLAVFDVAFSAAGASGVQTATTGAPQTGIAAGVVLAVPTPAGAGLSWTPIVAGSIGLPELGV